MNGYSKIKLGHHTNKSKSIDISDLQCFAQNPKPTEENTPKTQETNQIKPTNTKNTTTHEPLSEVEDEEDGNNGERFGVILKRNCSVSSTTSHRFRFDQKQSTPTRTTTANTLQSVRRAFSMRRSSSVSERYCRIYDQTVTLSSPIEDDDGGGFEEEAMDNKNSVETRSVKKKKKKQQQQQHRTGKILRACKSLFGL